MHTHYTTADDGENAYAKCNTCNESHYFKSWYFAKQWMNRHGEMFVRTFCVCH